MLVSRTGEIKCFSWFLFYLISQITSSWCWFAVNTNLPPPQKKADPPKKTCLCPFCSRISSNSASGGCNFPLTWKIRGGLWYKTLRIVLNTWRTWGKIGWDRLECKEHRHLCFPVSAVALKELTSWKEENQMSMSVYECPPHDAFSTCILNMHSPWFSICTIFLKGYYYSWFCRRGQSDWVTCPGSHGLWMRVRVPTQSSLTP